jgi:hypothetical protein
VGSSMIKALLRERRRASTEPQGAHGPIGKSAISFGSLKADEARNCGGLFPCRPNNVASFRID